MEEKSSTPQESGAKENQDEYPNGPRNGKQEQANKTSTAVLVTVRSYMEQKNVYAYKKKEGLHRYSVSSWECLYCAGCLSLPCTSSYHFAITVIYRTT
ncbi:hypothetical protein CEXT_547441 [Caerostris extrusa]|uniref:Uncharacterized protein n=1 Tax=Caerostris extrusa TaxID=172846 RepID=A0AAV4UFW1_CAEEX|nr:hypothetical protein CEXT_547441 [Caerostris extrusa]